MAIRIRGAREHNLKNIDVTLPDRPAGGALTVITGISGSGKTSLAFDTLYHEARRRLLDVYTLSSSHLRLSPADVDEIAGLGPAVAVGQNLLNRNPRSTLATASGLHPYLRLAYARYGERRCARCGSILRLWSEDELVEQILAAPTGAAIEALLVQGVSGSHRTLLALLAAACGPQALAVDGAPWAGEPLDPELPHEIALRLSPAEPARAAVSASAAPAAAEARAMVQRAAALGAPALRIPPGGILSRVPACPGCGEWFSPLEPAHFHQPCPHCEGAGCARCEGTGLHPEAAAVRWQGLRLGEWLARPVAEALAAQRAALPASGQRLQSEILRRLEALDEVCLGYVGLDRTAPTLSRGEAQRVRLAVALISRLEDMLHVLDEPTVGQHPADVARLLPAFRRLPGPVVFVEHDRLAAAGADYAIDIGPGAGPQGGAVTYAGAPAGLWASDTATGRYFSGRGRVATPPHRPPPGEFLTIRGARLRTLRQIDVPIPLGRLTVVTGVSGSGKSTLVEDVLLASLQAGEPCGCEGIEGPALRVTAVSQDPLGPNSRSNPATYTKLSDIIRDLYARETGLSPAHFSFNRPEGACSTCKGLGALEVQMSHLPSTWIPCPDCEGARFSDEVLAATVVLGGRPCSIADLYRQTIDEAAESLLAHAALEPPARRRAGAILRALQAVGLGYLTLGQPSPTLSGGEAQRVKLARHLGRPRLTNQLLVLDEPSTGLHPHDISGLLRVLDRLVRQGATVLVVEHNTDIMRAADWIVDMGPGAGPAGGALLYAGPVAGLLGTAEAAPSGAGPGAGSPDIACSPTARALREEDRLGAAPAPPAPAGASADAPGAIVIEGARAHNLANVNVEIPRGRITVVTGVSGSGKSSLVHDVLEAEARRRYLESLSMYERQGTREGPEAAVDDIRGLGVAIAVEPEQQRWANPRATVGSATEIWHHLSVLLALKGERPCPACGHPVAAASAGGAASVGTRCDACGQRLPPLQPRHFSPRVYASACRICHGLGTRQAPRPDKLIRHPELPLIAGAMYSPGFFPGGYLGKPFNGGYDMLQALAARYGFDPAATPWNEMAPEAQQAFLYGDPEPLTVSYVSRTGRRRTSQEAFPGFYGWIRDWDPGGTYTETVPCSACGGGGLRPEYAGVRLAGLTPQELGERPLQALAGWLEGLLPEAGGGEAALEGRVATAWATARLRLRFLCQVGLGYLHLGRLSRTLSAGEAQRIQLAGLLGSGLGALTVLLDEPTRGLHPAEVQALIAALRDLRDQGNTVIVVEHDPLVWQAADHLLDMGPGAGAAGGHLVASGSLEAVAAAPTPTGAWLRGERVPAIPASRRPPAGWMTIRNARGNNLRGIDVRIPLGTLTGVCGVSGSGKSTLVVDTLARVVAPVKHTTSMAQETLAPGAHDGIDGVPPRALVVDQSRAGVTSPARFLRLEEPLRALYAAGEDARALGLSEEDLGAPCTACGGRGTITLDMGFLPDVHEPCELCAGTGYRPEIWEVRLRGVPLPAVNGMTLEEVLALLSADPPLAPPALQAPLELACAVGLGYLAWRQPGYALSGGEAQRLRIARELGRRAGPRTLYILDEPTLGQHPEDVARLAAVLGRLVDAGHTVLAVEHNPHLLAACDWLIELGPGGGPAGGQLLYGGTPEGLARAGTPTSPALAEALDSGGNPRTLNAPSGPRGTPPEEAR